MKIQVNWRRLDDRAKRPSNAYGDDAGWDLFVLEDTFIREGQGVDVRTGVAVAIPVGFYGRIVGRSSAFRKRGVLVVEGIIDCGFRGELFSYAYAPRGNKIRYSDGDCGVELEAGTSVAQLIVQPVPEVHWVESHTLPYSVRGERGFGSSG